MRYDIPASELSLFEKNHEISFESFFSLDEHEILSHPKQGRFLFQKEEAIKKILTQHKLGETLFQLAKKRPIRLLVDWVEKKGKIDFSKISFQGIMIGIIVPHDQNLTTFFSSEVLPEITTPSYVALFGESNALYIHNPKDPHTHDLKYQGYVFGDRLKIEDFPFVYR